MTRIEDLSKMLIKLYVSCMLPNAIAKASEQQHRLEVLDLLCKRTMDLNFGPCPRATVTKALMLVSALLYDQYYEGLDR